MRAFTASMCCSGFKVTCVYSVCLQKARTFSKHTENNDDGPICVDTVL